MDKELQEYFGKYFNEHPDATEPQAVIYLMTHGPEHLKERLTREVAAEMERDGAPIN
jgi:hypothetical protein